MRFRLVLVLAFASAVTVLAQNAQLPGSHSTAVVKVLKVFLAKDGNSIFRAYLVRWNNNEVVAQDILATSDYHVGDEIKVLVVRTPSPKKSQPYDILSFHIVPPGLTKR